MGSRDSTSGAGGCSRQSVSFEDFSETADSLFAPIYPFLVQDFRMAVGKPLAGLVILEIGGGPGHMAFALAIEQPGFLIEVDATFDLLRIADRGRAERAPATLAMGLINGIAERLPLRDQCVDAVFSRGSIMFWEDRGAALREIRRVLKLEGCAWLGGGYGISTPDSIRADLRRQRRARREAQGSRKGLEIRENRENQESLVGLKNRVGGSGKTAVPRLSPPALLALALEVGGSATIYEDSPGFWLKWYPHRTKSRSRS